MTTSTISSVVSIVNEGCPAVLENVAQMDIVYLATWFYMQRRHFALSLMEQGYGRKEAVMWSRRAMKKLGLWWDVTTVAA